MNKIIRHIKFNGIKSSYSKELKHNIEIANIFNVIFIIAVLPFTFFFRASTNAILLTIIPILLHTISIATIKHHTNKLGRFIFSITSPISIYIIGTFTYISTSTGGIAVNILIISTIILPFMVFNNKEWKLITLIVFIDLLLMGTFNIINKQLAKYNINQDFDSLELRITSVFIAVTMFIALTLYYRNRINNFHKDTEEQSKILKQAVEEENALNEELKQNNEEMAAINNQLHIKTSIIEKQNNEHALTLKIVEQQQDRINEINKDFIDSVIYAKTIQDSLLPSIEVLDNYFKDYFILYEPKQTVSGDFYFAFKIDNYLVFAVADCTGHGISGGFLTMLGSSFLYDIVRRKDIFSPGEALNLMRTRIKEIFSKSGNSSSNGLDIALCAINTETNEMQYSGAFNPLIIIRNEKILKFDATRCPIGSYPVEKDFTTQTIKLENNDVIYLFSDGYADQIGINTGKKYSSKQFIETLFNLHGMPLKMQRQILEKTIRNWRGSIEQIDDITVLGIKWKT